MDLDKASLCEVPEALMYILRYLPMDNRNGDDNEDRGDGKSRAVSHKSLWLSICLCAAVLFFLLHVSLFICPLSFSLSLSLSLCLSLSLSLSFPASLLPTV